MTIRHIAPLALLAATSSVAIAAQTADPDARAAQTVQQMTQQEKLTMLQFGVSVRHAFGGR